MLAALLAISLFGIPLAAAAARLYFTDERSELLRLADSVALAVSGDLHRGGQLSTMQHPESGTRIAIYNDRGAQVSGDGPASSGLVTRARTGAVSSGTVNGAIAVAVPISDGDTVTGVVLASSTRAQVYARIASTWAAMLALACAALLISWAVARRQATRLARPLQEMSLAAERLGSGDFSVRTRPAGITELDSVNDSLNRTAAQLGMLLERERAFSADASHQLRTPLAGLRLALEAALEDPNIDGRIAMADALVSADRLEATITELIALARETPPHSDTPLDTARLLDEIRQQWNGPLAAQGRPLRIHISELLPPSLVPESAVRQILTVLVENASRHGIGAITILARDTNGALAIDVSQQGPPIARSPQHLFIRRAADAAGTGIGLALGRSLAESFGARLTVTSVDPPTFTLLTPANSSPATTD
jgi:signal transduction histidine kinase